MIDVEQRFLEFFKKNKHFIHEPGKLICSEESSTMFNIAGMQQFIDYFTEKKTSKYSRITTSQPCIRVGGKHCDLSGIGHTPFHMTYFKMLGNFSFKDYFKKEAINMAVDFLKSLKINFNYIYVTIYPEDKDALTIWSQLIDRKRIFFLRENMWSLGDFGPYGFCSEIFYDIHENDEIMTNIDNMLEIWNIVFMEFNKNTEGTQKLSNPFIDTGMGLERITSVVERTFDVFQTSLLQPIFKIVAQYNDVTINKLRLYTDHIRTACILIGENIRPGNNGAEYVLRNLIRKCYQVNNVEQIINTVIDFLKLNSKVSQIFMEEFNNFHLLIEKHKKEILKIKNPTEKDIFYLKDTLGIPYDISFSLFKQDFNENKLNDIATEKYKNDSLLTNIPIEYSYGSKMLCYTHNECSAIIKYIKHTKDMDYIITDQTCFYPTGGGQPGDSGYFLYKKQKILVRDTIKKNIGGEKTIIHLCEPNKILQENLEIKMHINEELRQARTRAHSGVHVLGDFLEKKFNCTVVSTNVGNDNFTIQVETENILNENKILTEVNNYLLTNVNVIKQYENRDETKADRMNNIQYDDIVRTVQMGPMSYQLCGGTHVDKIGSIGYIIIEKNSNAGHNRRKLQCLCGKKSINFMLQKNNQTNIKQSKIKKNNVFTIENRNIINNIEIIKCNGDSNSIIRHYKTNLKNKQAIYFFTNKKGNNIISFSCPNIMENIEYISRGGSNNMLCILTKIDYDELLNKIKN